MFFASDTASRGDRPGDAAQVGTGAQLNERRTGCELQNRDATALGRRHDRVDERAGVMARGRLDDVLVQLAGEGEAWLAAVEQVVEEPHGQGAGRRSHLLVLVGVDDGVVAGAAVGCVWATSTAAPARCCTARAIGPSSRRAKPSSGRPTVARCASREGRSAVRRSKKTGVSRRSRSSSSPMATSSTMTGTGAQMFGPRKTRVRRIVSMLLLARYGSSPGVRGKWRQGDTAP